MKREIPLYFPNNFVSLNMIPLFKKGIFLPVVDVLSEYNL